MKDTFLSEPLEGPGGQLEIVNILLFEKDPIGEARFYIWKIYFTGIVVEADQYLNIAPDQPKPEWHNYIIEKIKQLTLNSSQ